MRTTFIKGLARIGVRLPKSLNITSEFQEKLLQPNVYEVNLDRDLTLAMGDEPLVIARRNNRRTLTIDQKSYFITQQDPAQDVYQFTAANVSEAEINSQTTIHLKGGKVVGGRRAVFFQGGYQTRIMGMTLEHQRDACIYGNLLLQLTVDGGFYLPHKDGIVLTTQGINGGTPSNAQPNASTITGTRFGVRQEGMGTCVIVHSTNGVTIPNLIVEGSGELDYAVQFRGSSTHARLCTIGNMVHVELSKAPRKALFYTEIDGHLKIEGLHVQSQTPMCIAEVKHDGCKLIMENCSELPSGSYAVTHATCDIHCSDTPISMSKKEFWRRPKLAAPGTPEWEEEEWVSDFPYHRLIESTYRNGNTIEGGEPPIDTEFDPNTFDFKVEEKLHPFTNNGSDFSIIGTSIVSEWNTKSAMFSLGKLNGTQTGVIIPVVLNSPRTLGSLHLEIDGPNGIWRSRGSQQGSFAPAIPLNERFTFRLTLRGGKWTCGILHGASIEYDVYYRPTESSPTGKLGVNTIVSPTRQDGAAEINANTVLYIYDRDLTESEITTAMQYFHEQELPVKSMNVLKKTYLRLVSMLTPQK